MPSDLNHILGYRFTDERLLTQALTHGSVNDTALGNYERLEFLGDRVLGLIVAELLMEAYPDEPEGALTKRYHALVRRETLAGVARVTGLAAHVRLGASEVGRDTEAIQADICEAVLGALYLDGGLGPARNFIVRYFSEFLHAPPDPPKDAKSRLQEWTQALGLGLPQYLEVSRDGPDHAPNFTVVVTVEGQQAAHGQGASKRIAEQAAAEALLIDLVND
jgi:ribonuclease-3